ncbi:MAG: T9SS type A sorting domain-containing protein, partial [Bacteroidota bacterium]
GGRASITGGYVTPEDNLALPNHYIYGDFLSGRIWALDIATMDEQVILEPGGLGLPALNISSIDPHPSEPAILVTNYDPGIVYSLNRVSTSEEGVPEVSPLAVTLAGPNPFRQQTSIRVESPGPVRVTVVDLLGREVAQLWDGPAPPSPLVLDAPLAPGVYTVRAEGVGGSTSVRVVKAR